MVWVIAVSIVCPAQTAKSQADTHIADDYEFSMPDKWQLQQYKEYLFIQNLESGCEIRILQPQPSSGDLEKDALAVFDMMYAGWQFQKTGEQQYVLSKGFLPKGLEYCMMEAPMSITGADGRYNLEDGTALVVKAGNQAVIIAVRHTSLPAHIDCLRNYETWRRFFNSFTVKNAAIPTNTSEDVPQRIIGVWSQTESGASSEYVFAANGNYAFAGAVGASYTSTDTYYDYLHIKTYAFDGDGSYVISGNQLTLKKRGGTSPEQANFRFAQVNHGGKGWKDRLYLLTNDTFGTNETCYDKRSF